MTNKYITEKQSAVTIILFAIVFLVVSAWFTVSLMTVNYEIHKSCNLADNICPFTGVPAQGTASIIISVSLLVFGLFLFLTAEKSNKEEKVKKQEVSKTIEMLSDDERKVYDIIIEDGAVFQSDIVDKSDLNKVKITRILDRLEGKGLVERRRRGMSNVLVPKKQ